MFLNGQEVEDLFFKFGFAIPGSTNSWEQIIVSDQGNMIPAEVLSGNLVVETSFLTGNHLISCTNYRVFYD